MTEDKSTEQFIRLGEIAAEIVESAVRKGMLETPRFVAPYDPAEHMVVLSPYEYGKMQGRIIALTKALNDIANLSWTVQGHKPRSDAAQKIAREALSQP